MRSRRSPQASANRPRIVVITGASSGIGRATALRFASRGWTTVLAARGEVALREVAAACERAGAAATTVAPTDVADDAAVQRLARQAVDRHGRIDVWVNNAGVIMFGAFEQCPADIFQGVLDTNLGGCVNGSRAALEVFRRQGAGVLVNNASGYGKAAVPWASAYVASKHAVVGLSESLRMELLEEPDIHVCTVLPASVDTPIFRNAANYAGRSVRPIRPIYDASLVADAIVSLVDRPRRERPVGAAARLLALQHAIFPALHERVVTGIARLDHFRDEPAAETPGNVLQPAPGRGSISGGWRSSRAPLLRASLMNLALGSTAAYVGRRRRAGS